MVICLLGLMAVVAVPKAISFTSESRASKMQEAEAAIKTGMKLVHMKAQIQRQSGPSGIVDLGNGERIDVAYGYPIMTYGDFDQQFANFIKWTNLDIHNGFDVVANPGRYPDNEFTLARSTNLNAAPGQRGVQVYFVEALKNSRGAYFQCKIEYVNATASEPARVVAFLKAC